MRAPELRVRAANVRPVRERGAFVLYWMVAARRTRFNFALEHAIARARELDKPLIVLEALRIDYPWACDRFHQFILDGMRDNEQRFKITPVLHYPYIEPKKGAGRGLLAALSAHAALVVTDDYPAFFLPRMIASAAARADVAFECIDGNGLLPMRAADRAFPTAHSFRRFLQKQLRNHLNQFPEADPLAKSKLRKAHIPTEIAKRWPRANWNAIELSRLAIDHAIAPAFRGGEDAARAQLNAFLKRLDRYADARNHPDDDGASSLSPFLHFGQLGAHEIFSRVVRREKWTPARLSRKADGRREGWWGLSPSAEAFLDQLITWREIGFNFCSQRTDYDRYESLPEWAKKTLAAHARDRRPTLYSLRELENAKTHDPIWNAAQRQLSREGRLHNYLRMLWGKKILEWSPNPKKALSIMIYLNDKYAVDGRDPNSYSGIFWILGRYDRAWGPVRPIFGTIRYMSSASTSKKLHLRNYLKRYSEE